MFHLMPRDETFFDEMEALCGHVCASVDRFQEAVASKNGRMEALVGEIQEQERQAGRLTQEALVRLDRAFITPIDRDDILAVTSELQIVAEAVTELALRLRLYAPGDLGSEFRMQVETLGRVVHCLQEAVCCLRKERQLKEIQGPLNELIRLKQEADDHRSAFLGQLFAQPCDPLEVLKREALQELLHRAINACQNVSRTLQRVVLKNS